MNSRQIKQILIVIILAATAVGFIWYFKKNPEYIMQLKEVEIKWLALILVANCVAIVALSSLYLVLVRMVDKRIGTRENFLLTIYSSIINFFGPLQSGPGARAAYLKKRHRISLKAYLVVTLIYYGIYTAISAFLLLVSQRPWWQTIGFTLLIACISYWVIHFVHKREVANKSRSIVLRKKYLIVLTCLTAVQILCIVIRYYADLRSVGTDISFGQALSYTGAANFSLFVSITPDGIGIRESFLMFTQSIHGIATKDIIAASVVDRASYVAFLGLLFILAASMQAKKALFSSRNTKQSGEDSEVKIDDKV